MCQQNRSERVEVAQELIASLETANACDEARYAELRVAAQVGLDQIERGESIRVSVSALSNYLEQLSRGQLSA